MSKKKKGFFKWFWRILAAVVILLAVHPLWMGAVAKAGANLIAPMITGTKFRIESLTVNLYSLDIAMKGFMLGNPAAHEKSEPRAAAVDALHLDVDWHGLLAKRIHVEELAVSGVFVSYFSEGGKNNIDVILENVSGPKEKASEKPVGKAVEKPAAKPAGEPAGEPVKLTVDHLRVEDISIKMGMITMPVPLPLELDDIGAGSDGVTFAEFGAIVTTAVLNAAGNAGAALMSIGEGGINVTGDAIKTTTETIKTTGKQLESIGKGFRDMFKK